MLFWGTLFLIFISLAIYCMGAAFFVLLGFWQDDDGVYRWHLETPIFFLFMFGMLYGIYVWNPLG